MISTLSQPLTAAAIEFREAHPQASALEALDCVLGQSSLVPLRIDSRLLHPASNFGRLLAEAFDNTMTPDEWAAWAGEGSDVLLRDALMQVWGDEVLPRFAERYRISLS